MTTMNRNRTAQLGQEAVVIASEGRYRRGDGQVVEIGEAVRRCVEETRVFRPGEHFYAGDLLPGGSVFDANLHGHWCSQRGSSPLVTLFLKT